MGKASGEGKPIGPNRMILAWCVSHADVTGHRVYLSTGGDVLPLLFLHGRQRVCGVLLTRVHQPRPTCTKKPPPCALIHHPKTLKPRPSALIHYPKNTKTSGGQSTLLRPYLAAEFQRKCTQTLSAVHLRDSGVRMHC